MAPIGTSSSSANSKRAPSSTQDQNTKVSSVNHNSSAGSEGETALVTSPVGDGLDEMTFTKPRVIKSMPKSQQIPSKSKVDGKTDSKDSKSPSFDFDQISIN